MDVRKIIGIKIRKARIDKGFSIRSLAKKIRVSHGMIQKWEDGQVDPTLFRFYKLTNELEISLDEIMASSFEESREYEKSSNENTNAIIGCLETDRVNHEKNTL